MFLSCNKFVFLVKFIDRNYYWVLLRLEFEWRDVDVVGEEYLEGDVCGVDYG